jgi:hypothetical protein
LLLGFRNKASNRNAVAVQNKGHALVSGAIHAIGEVPRRLSNADGAGLHKIRLYDFMYSHAEGIKIVNPIELSGFIRDR